MIFVSRTNKTLQSASLPAVMAGKITVPVIISLFLVLGITFRLGMAGKALSEQDVTTSLQASVRQTQEERTDVDLARVQALNLFGETPVSSASAPTAVAFDASQTALNLQLEGVVLAAAPSRSAAIIVVGGKQSTYRVGETLPVGNQVRLQSVHNDHVIIANDGAAESLWLYDANKSAVSGSSGPARTTARSAGGTGNVINRLRAQRANAPAVAATLGEIIQVAPAQANGELVGYRLSPGVKLKEFVQLGFEENDIVTSVNGIALNDMRNLPQLYSLMNEATEVSFSLLRNGQPQTLQISLTGTP